MNFYMSPSVNYILYIVLFPDFVWRVCQKVKILVILYLFGGNLIKTRHPKAEFQGPIIWTELQIV